MSRVRLTTPDERIRPTLTVSASVGDLSSLWRGGAACGAQYRGPVLGEIIIDVLWSEADARLAGDVDRYAALLGLTDRTGQPAGASR